MGKTVYSTRSHPTLSTAAPFCPSICRLCLEDLESLGALSNIRASIRPAYDSITSSLVSHIVELTFSRPPALTVPAAPTADQGGSGRSLAAAAAAAGPPTHHNRISALLAERQDAAAMNIAAGGMQVCGADLNPPSQHHTV
jgi:hypothetical protein